MSSEADSGKNRKILERGRKGRQGRQANMSAHRHLFNIRVIIIIGAFHLTTMLTFTETLLMRLPVPASRFLLGVNNTSDPHHKRDNLRKLNRLRGVFERQLKHRGQIVWHVSCFLADSTLAILSVWGIGDGSPRQRYGVRSPTPAVGMW
jgi:hypothetical protein